MGRRLIALLMSVMIAVTFMPFMDFADSGSDPGIRTESACSGNLYLNSVSTPSQIESGKKSSVTLSRPEAGRISSFSVPVTLKKGIVSAQGRIKSDGSGNVCFRFTISKDKNLKDQVEGHVVIGQEQTNSTGYFEIPSDGEYYMGVYAVCQYGGANDWVSATQMTVNLRINWYAQAKAGSKLIPGKVYGVRCAYGDSPLKFKVTPARKGSLKIVSDSTTLTKLLNSAGTLRGTQASRTYYPTFGVYKGKTYQLKVDPPDDYGTMGYCIYVTNSSVTNSSGSSKSKAATLKRSTSRKGLIIAGSTKARWFKFKTTKKAKVKITVKGATNNKFRIEFYRGSTKLTKYTTSFSISNKTRTVTTSKVPKGTYYVKVTPVNKSSGWYSVKWTYSG